MRSSVVDLSRTLGSAGREALRRAELAVLVVRDDVRGVAAGREVARQIGGDCARRGLVVRQGRSRLLEPRLVASGVGWPLLGSFADDPALLLAAERGDPPARSARSSLARLCVEGVERSLGATPGSAGSAGRSMTRCAVLRRRGWWHQRVGSGPRT